MLVDQDNSGADVPEVPAPAEPGASAEDTPENVADQPASDDGEQSGGFSRLFEKARTDAAASQSQADPSRDEETTEEPEKAESDEEIPDEEAKPEEEAADESQPAEEKADEKPTNRSRAHKEVLEENETLKADQTKITERLNKLDSQFKEHGGVDVVETAMDVYTKLATGKAVEVINELPVHEKTRVQKAIFETAIGDHSNRVFGVNHVLKTDFGLSADLPQELLEKTFEFITLRLNDDAKDFEQFLERELEMANTPENEAARLRKELEQLKAKPEDSQKKADGSEKIETPEELFARVNQTYGEFETATFTTVADPEFKNYGFDVKPTDSQTVKDAKLDVQRAIRSLVGTDMHDAKAFLPLIDFWSTGDTENQWFKQSSAAYERAMRLKTQSVLKSFSKVLGLKPTAPKPPPADTASSDKTAIPGDKPRSSINPPPKNDKVVGFGERFGVAKQATQR